MGADPKRKWVVLVAVYLSMLVASSTSYMTGVLYVALLDSYHANKAKTSLVVALNSGLLCLLGPMVTALVDRFSCRLCVVAGGVLMLLSGLASWLVNSVDWLIFTYGIIGGIGNALAIVPGSVILSYYFSNYRSVVLALYMVLAGLGIFFASPLAMMFLDKFALRGAFLMIGAFNSHVCVLGALCKPSKLELEVQTKNRRRTHINYTKSSESVRKQMCETCSGFSIHKLCFPLFLISTFTWNVVISIFLVHLPSYARKHGATGGTITILMGSLSIANIIGRLLGAGAVGIPRLNNILVHVLCLGAMGVIASMFPLYSALDAAKYILAVSSGLLNGVPNSMMTPITIDIVGVEAISMAHGWEFFFCGLGFLVGPPIVGAMYDQSGSYRNGFIFAGAMYDQSGSYRNGFIFAGVTGVLGGILAVAVDRIHKSKRDVKDAKAIEIH